MKKSCAFLETPSLFSFPPSFSCPFRPLGLWELGFLPHHFFQKFRIFGNPSFRQSNFLEYLGETEKIRAERFTQSHSLLKSIHLFFLLFSHKEIPRSSSKSLSLPLLSLNLTPFCCTSPLLDTKDVFQAN